MSQQTVERNDWTVAAAQAELRLESVGRTFAGVAVLSNIDLEVAEHGRVGIVGRSGAGKSTLLTLIAGLDEPSAGVITVGGETSAKARLSQCTLMPQRDCLLPWRTALDNAGIALENQGVPRKETRERVAPLFARFGLRGAEGLHPAKLSGGMRQRVAFVRTLVANKPVLLLDEPFGALDAITRAELQEWLRGALLDEPRTVLLVTHDIEEALLLCDRVFVLAGGRTANTIHVDLAHDLPRRELVTSADFVELREQALEAIA